MDISSVNGTKVLKDFLDDEEKCREKQKTSVQLCSVNHVSRELDQRERTYREVVIYEQQKKKESELKEQNIQGVIRALKLICQKYPDQVSYISDEKVRGNFVLFDDFSEHSKKISTIREMLERLNYPRIKSSYESRSLLNHVKDYIDQLTFLTHCLGIKSNWQGHDAFLPDDIMMRIKTMCGQMKEFKFSVRAINEKYCLYGKEAYIKIFEKLEESVMNVKNYACSDITYNKLFIFAQEIGVVPEKNGFNADSFFKSLDEL